ncbi:MAG: cell division protein ZapA [Devosiaceae bacterium]|nr:cell division protein ZapA [Devosiaceae bacterium]
MGEVSVEINGRKFRMACEDDQEAHLTALAERFNTHVEQFKGSFGEIGDNRLTVMAGIAVLDELVEAERKIAQLEGEVTGVHASRQEIIAQSEALKASVAKTLSETARKIEAVATVIDETATGK